MPYGNGSAHDTHMGGDVASIVDFKRLQGQRAKAFGALFENMFQNTCRRTGIAVTRVPDGCRSLGSHKLIRVKTPFDWICTYMGKTALLDTKTCLGHAFSHSQIAEHQIHELVHHEINGATAGYVIWLRKNDDVIFVEAKELEQLAKKRGAISVGDPYARLIGKGRDFNPRAILNPPEWMPSHGP